MNGFNIVLDVNSGSIHVVDEVVYDILDFDIHDTANTKTYLIDKYDPAEIIEAMDEVLHLKLDKVLFSEDLYENIYHATKSPVVKALCLHVAHDCNLKCKYCFAQEGEYSGKRSLMSYETGKTAIDFIIKHSGNRRNLEIDFFGGEPLMNFEVVKKIVSYAREQEKIYNKNFRFTITTNGLLLDPDIEDYINENMSNVVLSIDGRKSINDSMRIRAGGQGSYDSIVPKFQRIAERRNQDNYYVRGTFTRDNLDFSKDVLHMADLGFKQISIEPVVLDESADYAITESDLQTVFEEYEKLALEILEQRKNGKNFNFFHFMIDLTGGPCVAKRVSGCGAGTEYLAVTPEGDLFPCHQFVGDDQFKMGSVFQDIDSLNKLEKRDQFDKCHIYAKDECKECFAKFYCSGGCMANAYNINNDLLKPYAIGCELQRKRTECAIMIKVAEQLGG